jgi:hypothetical protein
MRKYQWAEAIMLPLVTCRAKEIAFKMGGAENPNYCGKVVRFFGEPLCWLLGQCTGEQNWEVLYEFERRRT